MGTTCSSSTEGTIFLNSSYHLPGPGPYQYDNGGRITRRYDSAHPIPLNQSQRSKTRYSTGVLTYKLNSATVEDIAAAMKEEPEKMEEIPPEKITSFVLQGDYNSDKEEEEEKKKEERRSIIDQNEAPKFVSAETA